MSEENLAHELRVIVAGGEEPISWPFLPDWVQLWPDEVIAGIVEVRARGSIPFPLTGFAPMLLNKPGRTIQLRNTTLVSQSIHVVAGLGIEPPQFVLPTTLAEATAYKVISELSIETLTAFNYQHAAGMLLIGCVSEKSTTAAPTLTALTAAGVSLTLLTSYSRVITNHGVAARWAYKLLADAGTIQIIPTFSAVDFARFHLFSITGGASVGNESGEASSTTPISSSIVNQYPSSKSYSMAIARAGSVSETSGATLMDSWALGTSNCLLHRIEQLGSYAFSYANLGDAHAIAQVEIFI